LAGSATENVTILSFASDQMHADKLSQLRALLSSDDSDRQQGVAMWILLFLSLHPDPYARCRHRDDVDWLAFTVVGVNFCGHRPPWWRWSHECSRNCTLTGTNFLLVPSHSARSRSSSSQYFSCTNHFSCGCITTFYWRLASKASMFSYIVRRLVPLPWRHTPRLLVMSNDQISSQNIRIYAAKQACALNTTRLVKSQPSNVATQIQEPRLSQSN